MTAPLIPFKFYCLAPELFRWVSDHNLARDDLLSGFFYLLPYGFRYNVLGEVELAGSYTAVNNAKAAHATANLPSTTSLMVSNTARSARFTMLVKTVPGARWS